MGDKEFEEYEYTNTVYDEFGQPTVTARKGTAATSTSCDINVPATGLDTLGPEELRELADEIERDPESALLDLLFDGADSTERMEFADSLREAAEWVEEVREAQ